jgi:hypothetical protein
MSVVVIGDDLRERVAQGLRDQARRHPRASLAAQIKPEAFDQVVLETSRRIDLEIDFDTSLTANLGRVRDDHPSWFNRRQSRPGVDQFKNFWSHV